MIQPRLHRPDRERQTLRDLPGGQPVQVEHDRIIRRSLGSFRKACRSWSISSVSALRSVGLAVRPAVSSATFCITLRWRSRRRVQSAHLCMTIRNAHGRKHAGSSSRRMPRTIASHASWTTSDAASACPVNRHACRRSRCSQRPTSVSSALASPSWHRSTRSSSRMSSGDLVIAPDSTVATAAGAVQTFRGGEHAKHPRAPSNSSSGGCVERKVLPG